MNGVFLGNVLQRGRVRMDCALIFNGWCRFDRIVGWPGCIKNHTPEFPPLECIRLGDIG
jgi:hypothetical protein